MKPIRRMTCLAASLVLVGTAVALQEQGEEFAQFADDGWYTWQVAAIEGAPAWCCIDWRSGRGRPQTCNLDRESDGYSEDSRQANTTGRMQLYARIVGGNPTEIRTLSPRCPIQSSSSITDLGPVAADSSVRWLAARVEDDRHLGEDALAAIATHAGRVALPVLQDAARTASSIDIRKHAMFWMGRLRGRRSLADLGKFMFNDDDPEIREHAAFAVAQSDAPGRSDLLIRQGRTDSSAEVRSQAWFWLADSGAADAEAAIKRALREERDAEVREEAVFALSQLPDERAVTSLIAVLENRQLEHFLREAALFWLAQTDSDVAYEHIERLLAQE